MTRALAVARNTLREVVRDRILIVLAAFGLATIVGAQALSPLALGEGRKIVLDFGLAGSALLATILSVFLGSSLLHKELDRRTIFAILAKPIQREEFLLGKFFGLWATAVTLLLGMTVIVLGVMTVAYQETPWRILGATALTIAELAIVNAFVVLFSSFTTPTLTTLFTMGAVLAGNFAEDLRHFSTQGAPAAVSAATKVAFWILPRLDVFNARGLVVHGVPIGSERFLFALAYGALYAIGILVLAGTIFRRREFR